MGRATFLKHINVHLYSRQKITTRSQAESAQDDIRVGNIKREKLRARAFSGPGLVSSPKPATAEISVNRLSGSSDRLQEASEILKHNEIQTTPSTSKQTETKTVDSEAEKTDIIAVPNDSNHSTESQIHLNDTQTPGCSNEPEPKPEIPSSLFLFDHHTSALDASLFSETELLTELKKKFGCEHEDGMYSEEKIKYFRLVINSLML